MSVEQTRFRLLVGAVGLRCVVEGLTLASNVTLALGRGIEQVADGLFGAEQDYAERYRNLTGVDIGVATGCSDRYSGNRDEA